MHGFQGLCTNIFKDFRAHPKLQETKKQSGKVRHLPTQLCT